MPDFLREEMEAAQDEFAYRQDQVALTSKRPFDRAKFSQAYQEMCLASREFIQLKGEYNEREGNRPDASGNAG